MSEWTHARIEQLTNLWKDGWSGSKIAITMGGLSRSAVIAKTHRLRLPGRPKPPPAPKRERTSKIAFRTSRPFQATEDTVAPKSLKVTLLELEEYMCRWPLGDPKTKAFRYCGLDKHPNHISYCVGHAALSYRAPQPRAARTGWDTRRTALS